jgi:cytochrome P450
VHFVPPLALWVILRHDDVKRLFSDMELATPDRAYWEFFQPAPEGSYMRWVQEHSLFAVPPAEHARLRRLFSVALTPRAVKRYDRQVRETVERFAAPLRGARGMIELIEAMLDFLPPGSRCREDLIEYQTFGPFRRPMTLPIEPGPC